MTKEEALRMALEALESVLDDSPKVLDASILGGLYEVVQCREAITAIKEALEQPEPNKDGSPCPEFWDWLPKAYNFDGNGAFTKYNMEVAFLAGKQTSQPEQEPVAWEQFHEHLVERNFCPRCGKRTADLTTIHTCTPPHPEREPAAWLTEERYAQLHTAQRPWVGLTGEEIHDTEGYKETREMYRFARAIEAKLKEKNA